MDDQARYRIPTRLDDPPKFLFWDFDIAAVFFIVLCLGIAVGFLSVGVLCGGAASYLWSKARAGRHPGYAVHVAYWNTSFRLFRRSPPSARRVFYG